MNESLEEDLRVFRLHCLRLRQDGAVKVYAKRGKFEYLVDFEGAEAPTVTEAHSIGFNLDSEDDGEDYED